MRPRMLRMTAGRIIIDFETVEKRNAMIPKIYSVGQAVKLRVCRTEKFKTAMLSVSAVLPIRQESVWMTTLLLSVLRRGTEKYPTLEDLNRRLDYLYGTELSIRNFYRGNNHVIGFSADLLSEAYLPQGEDLIAEALDVMRQILFFPALDENGLLQERYVKSEQIQQCDAIRALKNNPRAYAAERMREELYAKEPCGALSLGTEDEVMAVSAKELTDYWRAWLKTLTLDCFYVGDGDPEPICDRLRVAFSDLLCADAVPTPYQGPVELCAADPVRRVDEALEVGQGQLLLGLRTQTTLTDREFYACMVYNELLGTSPISKLFMNVRERLSLCYHCSSTYHAHNGAILIHCGLSRVNRRAAEDEILRQIEQLTRGEISDEELRAAKYSLCNAYLQIEDSPAALESFYFSRAMAGVTDSAADCRARFARITREDVVAVAQKMALDTVYYLDGLLDNGEEETDDGTDA